MFESVIDWLAYSFNFAVSNPLILVLLILQIPNYFFMIWSFFIILLGLPRKKRIYPDTDERNSFAVIICAKNEEGAIAGLLNAIEGQDYPKDKYHVYLLLDHCTDRTKEIASAYPFVTCLERTGDTPPGKGQLLKWGFEKLLARKDFDHNAFMFFDADNIPIPTFMKEMNKRLAAGDDIIQGNRKAGKPFRTAVTSWYAIYWVFQNYIFQYSREKRGFNCQLTGTGLVLRRNVVEDGGFETTAITEDMEFSHQRVLKGNRIHYSIDAVVYDEQPSDLRTMYFQLRRWCSGVFQVLPQYVGKYRKAIGKKPSVLLFDFFMLFLSSVFGAIATVCGIISTIYSVILVPEALFFTLLTALLTFPLAWLLELIFLKAAGVKGTANGFFTFPIFLVILGFCTVISAFKHDIAWKRIEHKGVKAENG